jgi:hypothetical protein
MDNDYQKAASVSHHCLASAKFWFYTSLSLKAAIFVLGAGTVFFSFFPEVTPFLVAILSVVSEISRWRSDDFKGTGEKTKRQLEEHDGFGWSISKSDLADVMAECPKRFLATLSHEQLAGSVFASDTGKGPKRAVENLRESAWWSKHLAKTTATGLKWIILILFIGAIFALLVSIRTVADRAVLANIAKVVTSTLVLGFSLGLLRLLQSYIVFSQKAGDAEQKAERLLKEEVEVVDALRALGSYQMARASAPLLPTFVWKLNKERLNNIWDFRVKQTPAETSKP